MAKNPNKDINHSNKLSILIARDGLYFCVSSEHHIQAFYEKEFDDPQSLEDLIKEIKAFFSSTPGKELVSVKPTVEVTYAHALYAMVPTTYFDKNHLSDYLKFNVRLLPTDELNYDELKEIEANMVYVPFTNINNYLFDNFGSFTYCHFGTGFIEESCRTVQDHEGEQQVFIQVFPTHIMVAAFGKGNLLLCNSFDYFAPEDFVYYVLFVLEQLKFDPETVKVWLSGSLDKVSPTFELLYTYIRYISFVDRTPKWEIKDKRLKDTPTHKHYFFIANL